MRTLAEHVPEDRLVRYAGNGELPEPELSRVERHLLACVVCQDRLARVDAMRAAGEEDAAVEKLSAAIAFWQAHPTREGLVRLWVQAVHRHWTACIRGRQLDCRFTCGSRETAVETCTTALRELYPDHRCGAACVSRAADGAPLTAYTGRKRGARRNRSSG